MYVSNIWQPDTLTLHSNIVESQPATYMKADWADSASWQSWQNSLFGHSVSADLLGHISDDGVQKQKRSLAGCMLNNTVLFNNMQACCHMHLLRPVDAAHLHTLRLVVSTDLQPCCAVQVEVKCIFKATA